MINYVINGEIDLTEYWSVGEERSVHISAMEAIGVGESHVEQDQTLVILHGPDCFDLVDGGKNLFVIGLKGLLFNNTTLMFERGYINSIPTNLGGWKDSNRRSWCDDVFMKALPEEVQKWFKKFKYLAGKGSKSTETDELENYFTFPCQFEVFKTNTRAAAENTIQFDYYTIEANRIKYKDGSTTTSTYWMRSASTSSTAQFLAVSYEGKSSYISATNNSGLAPFGCV